MLCDPVYYPDLTLLSSVIPTTRTVVEAKDLIMRVCKPASMSVLYIFFFM